MDALSVEGLTKDYKAHFWSKRRRALDHVSFAVKAGEIFGFLGPNGSGKSTTIKILLGIIFPSEGSAKIFDKSISNLDNKRRIGFLPENPYFQDFLTAREFLEFHGSLHGISRFEVRKRVPSLLERVGMAGTAEMTLRSFSKGMLQRIGLAQAILHDPDLVILDEPMTGLDPIGRKEVRDLALELKKEGKTVFFSTHILSDVELICDRVALLRKGKLLSCTTLDRFSSFDLKSVEVVWAKVPEFLNPSSGSKVELTKAGGHSWMIVNRRENEAATEFTFRINDLVQKGTAAGGIIYSVSPKTPSLEDIFMQQIGPATERAPEEIE